MSGIVSGIRFGTALTVLGCLALAACGGGANSTPGAGSGANTNASGSAPTQAASSAGGTSGGSGGAVFSGTINVTGSVTASGSWTDTNEAWPQGCHDWATTSRAGAGPLNVPGPGGPMDENVSGHHLGIAFVLPGYTGPGTFTTGVSNTGLNVDYHVYTAAGYKLVINGDGSGSLTFSNAADPLNSSAVISGSETWTCH